MKEKLGRWFITVYNIQCFRIQRVAYWTWQLMWYQAEQFSTEKWMSVESLSVSHTQSSVRELIDTKINASCRSTYTGNKYGHLTKLADSGDGFMYTVPYVVTAPQRGKTHLWEHCSGSRIRSSSKQWAHMWVTILSGKESSVRKRSDFLQLWAAINTAC